MKEVAALKRGSVTGIRRAFSDWIAICASNRTDSGVKLASSNRESIDVLRTQPVMIRTARFRSVSSSYNREALRNGDQLFQRTVSAKVQYYNANRFVLDYVSALNSLL